MAGRQREGMAQIQRAAALTAIITVPGGHLHYYIACDDRLAREARLESKIGSGFDAIELIVVHRRKIDLSAGFHVNMTGSTGAASAAGMLDLDTEIQGYIKN